jgi:class 3 adenylate cyclase
VRYFKVTLLIGFLVSLLLIGLDRAGVFGALDQRLFYFVGGGDLHPVPRLSQAILAVGLAFGIAWTTVDINRLSLKCIIAGGALIEVLTATWVVNLFGFFFSPFPSLLAVTLSFAAGFAYAHTTGGSRKRMVHSIFGDRISDRTFHTLIDSDVPLNFEGDRCDATVVVCEIFNQEQLANSLPVNNYVAMHNAFLRNASEFLVERGGYLDECDGESLRVIFGTPAPDASHAITGCEAALALAARLEEVNRECAQIWKQMFDFRIGVNTGEMIVAAYGSRHLGSFSVSGEPVEFARRLCAANTIYGSRILLGAETFSFAESAIEVRPMEIIQRHPETRQREEVYELLALRNVLSSEELERRDLFWKGIVYYREQLWDEALSLFYSARAPNGSDGPVEFYIRRIEQLREGLPSLDWNNARL